MEMDKEVEVAFVREVGKPLYETRSYLKLIGGTIVVMGLLQLLGVISFYIAIPSLLSYAINWQVVILPGLLSLFLVLLSIFMGAVLFSAGSAAGKIMDYGDKSALVKSLKNLKIYFAVVGTLLMIVLVFLMAYLCVLSVFSFAGPLGLSRFLP
jgi:hypothetical protein